MKYGIIFVAVIGVAFFHSAKAQDIEYISSALEAGQITSISVSGDYAYCSIGHLLLTLSVSDPTSPSLVNSSPGLGGDGAVLNGNLIYFIRYYDVNPQVQIVDISDPINPIEITRFSGFSYDIYVDSSYLYLTRAGAGLYLFDNSNPFDPVQISSINTPGRAKGVDVTGQYAYIADGDSGLTIVNVADPYNPNIVGRYDNPSLGGHRFRDISVSGDFAFVADSYFGLRIFDVSNPATPQYHSFLELPESASRIIIDGNLAYTTTGYDGITYIIDIADPSVPVLLNNYGGVGSPERIFIADSLLYVGGETDFGNLNSHGLMHIVDVADPDYPAMIGEFELPPRSSSCAFVSDNYVYSGGNLLYMVDFSDPFSPTPLGHFDMPYSARDVWVQGEYAFVVASSRLYVLSFADPLEPFLAVEYSLLGSSVTLFLYDDYAYVSCHEGGLRILNISDPVNPILAGSFQNGEDIHDVAVSGDYAYLAAYSDGLIVLDIEDPADPDSVGGWQYNYSLGKIQVSGNYVYLSSGSHLIVLDVANPASPEQIGVFDAPHGISDFVVQGNLAFVVYGSAFEFAIVDVSDPGFPQQIDSHELPDYGRAVSVFNEMIYVATLNSLLAFRYATTSIIDTPIIIPVDYLSSECYPNPFNASTTIQYTLPVQSNVILDIYDLLGRQLKTLIDEHKQAGVHTITFDASDLSSGVYFYKLQAGDAVETRRMVLLK